MGIQGLWPVLEPTAQPVTLESLEGKKFAIDVSIWLYQAQYGYGAHQQDARCPHLSLILNRLSKLLFYKIQPIFVFDGPNVPVFKRRILRDRELKRYLDEMTVSKAQKRALAEMAQQNHDDETSQEKWKSAFGGSSKRKNEQETMFQISSPPSTSAKKSKRGDSSEPEVVYSTIESEVPSKTDDAEILASLVTRDERLDYLLGVRERERTMRLTEEQIPENSQQFCGFQMQRLLRRNRVNDQLDMLKKEALGQIISDDKKPDSSGSKVLMSVMEGLTRGHIITRDDNDILTDDESTARSQQIKESVSWPAMIERMKKDAETKKDAESKKDADQKKLPDTGWKMNEDAISSSDGDDDNDDDLQEAISLSLSESVPQKRFTLGRESKGDMIERLRNAFAARNRDLQRDNWSASDKSSSESDEFIDVNDPEDDFLKDSQPSTSEMNQPKNVSADNDDDEDWMPSYVNEFDSRNERLTKESEFNQQQTEQLEHEQEGVYKECQELLRLCGMPFIISPGEAEAQCCELERLGIVQGVVSDDSDVWLFGALNVYKNLFNMKRRVQMFSSRNIQQQLGLTRWEMISIAMLSGGDYTSGLENVGVVTALELISEFAIPLEKNQSCGNQAFSLLKRISDWVNRRNDFKEIKEDSKPESDASPSKKSKRDSSEKGFETAQRLKLRAVVEKNTDQAVLEAFPSREIFDAYTNPQVDSSEEKPVWSTVNEKDLEIFVWNRLGWDKQRLNKQTQGSLQKWNEYMGHRVGGKGKAYQTHITSFAHKLQKSQDDQRISPTKRVLTALRRLASAKKETPDPSVSLICKSTLVDDPFDGSDKDIQESGDTSQNSSKPKSKRFTKKMKTKENDLKDGENPGTCGIIADQTEPIVKNSAKSRKRGAPISKTKRIPVKSVKNPGKSRKVAKNLLKRKPSKELNLSEASTDEE